MGNLRWRQIPNVLSDAKAKLPTGDIVGDFKDNDGWVYGVRLSYQKK